MIQERRVHFSSVIAEGSVEAAEWSLSKSRMKLWNPLAAALTTGGLTENAAVRAGTTPRLSSSAVSIAYSYTWNPVDSSWQL